MGPVTLFMVCAILSSCSADMEPERHSLYYVYTALSQPVSAPGIYEFTAMGLLDDRKIDYYNSQDKVKIPEQDWMKAKLPADYWEKGTQSRKSKEQWFKVNVNILMERMRHNASDTHSLMWRHGCEAVKRPDGSLQFHRGVDEYSYDGRDFLSFDDNSMQWVAPVTEAFQTKQKWDGVPILNQYTKGYLEKECVEWLDKFRTYGDEELAESITHHPPEVHLFAKNGRPHGRYLLTCLATGFFPKDIKISILKNDWPEKDGHQDDVLPNGDGTHQIRLTIIAEKVEINMYRCRVEHRTLKEPILAEWEKVGVPPPEDANPIPIGAVVGGIVAVVLIGAGLALTGIAKKKEKLCFAPPPPPDPLEPEERDALHVDPNNQNEEPVEDEEAPFVVTVDQQGTDRKDSSDSGCSPHSGSPTGSADQLPEASSDSLEAAVDVDETQQASPISQEMAEKMVDWLRHNDMPRTQVERNMLETAIYRAQWFKDNPGKSISEALEMFPRLLCPGMIAQDFAVLHNDASGKLIENWSRFSTKLLKVAQQEGKTNVDVESLSQDSKDYIALRILPSLMPPPSFERGGKMVRTTISDGMKAFMDVQPVGTNLVEYLDTAGRTRGHPYTLVLGDDRNCAQAFAIIDGKAMEHDTIVQAVDVAYKAYYIFHLNYPEECSTAWQFLQEVYTMGRGNVTPAVSVLHTAVDVDETQQGTGSDTDDTGKGTSSKGSSDGSSEDLQGASGNLP